LFTHPWFQTWIMFIGEATNFAVFLTLYFTHKGKEKYSPRLFAPILAIPMLCDTTGSTLSNISLLYITGSVWQMLRSANIVFAGILAVIFLKRKLFAYHWIGMAIVVLGLTLVGTSSLLSPQDTSGESGLGNTVFGISLVLGAQLVVASQVTLEERLLKGSHYPPIQVVGTEGLFGTLFMGLIVLPILYFIPGSTCGSYENSIDALIQIGTNNALFGLIIVFIVSIAFYNWFAQSVTASLTAVHRTLIDACRTLLIWVVDLFIYYVISPNFGEEWTQYSYLEVIGFMLLLFGTFVYNSVIRFNFLYYPAQENLSLNIEGDKKDSEKLVINEASTLLNNSNNLNAKTF